MFVSNDSLVQAVRTHHTKGTTVHVSIQPTIPKDTSPERTAKIELTSPKMLDKLLRKRWFKKLGWSIVTLLPEVTFAIALYENRSASILQEKIQGIYLERANLKTPSV